ncbi:MAG TPA: outer membrane protein transport protein [Luteitalea sp.]|nr:outer membrane protein transport protein [Luteitalea sp.]
MHVLASLVVLTAALTAALPAAAQSVGVFRTASGARAATVAGADSALGSTPLDALTFNPAGLAGVDQTQAAITLGAASATGSFVNRVDGSGGLRNARGVVPEGAVAWKLSGRRPLVLGAAFNADGAIGGDWQYRDAPGIGGASYGIQTHRSAITVARATVGAGLQLTRTVAVGASLSALRNDNELVAPYIFQSQAPLVGLKTLLSVDTGGWGWGGTVGVTARPSERLAIGASYRTSTSLTTRGSATGDVSVQLQGLGLAVPGAFTYDAAVANRFPQQASLSARGRVTTRLHLLGQVDWWDWSDAFRSLDITLRNGSNATINAVVGQSTIEEQVPLRWRDQIVRRVGAEYAYRPGLVLRGGYAYGGQVVPADTLTPMTAAIIAHTLGAGIGMDVASGTVDLAFQWSPTTTRAVTRSTLAGSGEYDGTRTGVGMRALSLGWTRRF